MKITFAPRGVLQIDDARITYRNFSGVGSPYNREGDRNFAVVIDDPYIANELIEEGWHVKTKPPRREGDDPFVYLPVKVKFNEKGPIVYLQSGRSFNRLDEEDIARLDHADILQVDLDIRPYDWEVNGKTGRTAYLKSIKVTQEVDRFAVTYAEEEHPEE